MFDALVLKDEMVMLLLFEMLVEMLHNSFPVLATFSPFPLPAFKKFRHPKVLVRSMHRTTTLENFSLIFCGNKFCFGGKMTFRTNIILNPILKES